MSISDRDMQEFDPAFDDLARQVIDVVTLAYDWAIPPAPRGETFDREKTNVELLLDGTAEGLGTAASSADCGRREGWHYDDAATPQRVFACPATCARIQAALYARVDLLLGRGSVPEQPCGSRRRSPISTACVRE